MFLYSVQRFTPSVKNPPVTFSSFLFPAQAADCAARFGNDFRAPEDAQGSCESCGFARALFMPGCELPTENVRAICEALTETRG